MYFCFVAFRSSVGIKFQHNIAQVNSKIVYEKGRGGKSKNINKCPLQISSSGTRCRMRYNIFWYQAILTKLPMLCCYICTIKDNYMYNVYCSMYMLPISFGKLWLSLDSVGSGAEL